MARHVISSPLTIAIAVLALILGAAGAAVLISSTCVEPKTVSALQTPDLGAINVTVVDNAGRPIVNVTVMLNGTAFGNLTLENGTCLIEDLAPNETGLPYTVSASKDGYLESQTVNATVEANVTTNVTLMIRGGWIYGTVTSSTGPISGATVSITELGYSANVSPTNGIYNLDGLPAGPHNVTATAQGYAPSLPTPVFVPLAGVVEANFVLVPLGGFISGHTFHALLHTPLEATNVSIEIGKITFTVQSDADGYYSFDNTTVPEGVYNVTASRDGFFSASFTGVKVFRGNRTSGVDLNLTERPTRLYGVIRSGQVLLVGANVSIVGADIFALSGADGNYEIRNLTAGAYAVTTTVQGYETLTIANVIILPGGDTQLNFNMTGLPGAALRGVVKDSRTGVPLANVLVTVIDLDPLPRSVITNINGEFEFPALPADNYTLRFEKTGYSPLEIANLEAVEGSTKTIEFQMTPLRETFGGFIEGLDMAHSMMVIALGLTCIILGVAVILRMRAATSPSTAPAVYDQAEEEKAEEENDKGESEDDGIEPEDSEDTARNKKVRKLK